MLALPTEPPSDCPSAAVAQRKHNANNVIFIVLISPNCSPKTEARLSGFAMTISRLHTNPSGLRNLGVRGAADEGSAIVCTFVEGSRSLVLESSLPTLGKFTV